MGADKPATVFAIAGRRARRRRRTRIAAITSMAMVATLLNALPAQAVAWPPTPKDVTGIPVYQAQPQTGAVSSSSKSVAVGGPKPVVWPLGQASVELATATADSDRTGAKPGRVQAGNLPVWIGASADKDASLAGADSPAVSKATVNVHDRATATKAGVDGLLISVSRADGRQRSDALAVEIGYGSFAKAFGADWSTRLRLYAMPACVLTTPQAPQCHNATELTTTRNLTAKTLTAQATVAASGATLLAIQSGPSGDNGDFNVSSLSQSGTWNVGAQTGDFSWSYPLRVPPAFGGPVPSLGVAYSSGSVDGRTAASNNQAGWIGDGWSFWPGSIERKYASCNDDNPGHKTGDVCWFSNNATLSLNGHAGELIETGAANVFRLKDDDGTRVEKLAEAARGNGDDDNEYWKVTTVDGMQYFFGYHKLPGWTTGKPLTDSTWTVPVYGNNSGEPCYNATFANAWCTQAWRWNLDYVVDPHGNSLAYFYGKEPGWYGRDLTASQRTEYVRGGWLDHIDYGMRQGSEYTFAAPMRVRFDTAERCLASCWTGTAWASAPIASAWLDTPWDQDCAAAPCTNKLSPTFWSARRLTTVTTQVRTDATNYRPVDSWALRQEFLNAGDNEGSPLWLRGITHTGHVTTAGGGQASIPEIIFGPGAEPLPNRVDGPADGRTSLTRFRVKTITTEAGGQINIAYSGPDCTRDTVPVPESNTKRCMPSYYSPGSTPVLDWFHKYVVTSVNLHDVQYTGPGGVPVANNQDQTSFYDYLDTPAWHYTTDEITPDKYRTWGDFRGYSRIQVRSGKSGGLQTATEYRYLRGMDGDKQTSGVRDVWVSDSWGGTTEDHEALNGFLLQEIAFNGPGGAELTSTVYQPWLNGPTATRTRAGVTTNAFMYNAAVTRVRTPLSAPPAGPGGWRTGKTVTTFNNDGLPVAVDIVGDENVTGDETCSRTVYARNDSIWMIDKVAQVETLSVPCAQATTPAAPSTVLQRARAFYDTYVDDTSFGSAPTEGELRRTEELDSWSGNTPIYVRTGNSTHDQYGRVVDFFDARGYKTTNGYTHDPATGLVISTTSTNALSHTQTSYLEPAWDAPTKTVDPNGVVTEATYDGLGRVTNVWLPGRDRATQPTAPSAKYTYLTRSTGGPTAVTTETLLPAGADPVYRKQVSLYDGFLRTRQTQTQATGGGRLITDTLYHAIGAVDWTSGSYYDSTNAAVDTTLGAPSGQIPSITQYQYDGAARTTATILIGNGTEKWRTTTAYDGDRTHVTPPDGGTATTTINDVFSHTIQLRQYKTFADVGSSNPATYDTTSYQYDLIGRLKTLTDAAGNTWTNQYDLRGRQIQTSDPDRGTSTAVYDAAGNPATVTVPNGTGTATIAFTYDELGRTTSMRDDTVTGPLRAQWVYDQTPIMPGGTTTAKGQLTSATRYMGGNAYTTKIDAYDTFGRPTTMSVVLPTAEADLCAAATPNTCTYTTAVEYRPNGDLATMTLPLAADLASEKLTFGYTDVGQASSLQSPIQRYAGSVSYNKLGQLTQRQLGNTGKRIALTYDFDEPTRRLSDMNVVVESGSELANYHYTYDKAGNVTAISEAPQGQTADHQCFQYDYLRRLTEAWTPTTGDCNPAVRSLAGLGGPAPYWHSWTYNNIGNRTTEVQHATTNTTFTYTYPSSGPTSIRPHAVTNITATGGQTFSRNYTYDNAGNTKTQPTTGTTQTLTWDRERRLTALQAGTNTTNYLYDADGDRLIRKDPDGSKTLYLPDGTEIRNVGTVKTAKRYYRHAGTTVAVRTATAVTWICGDHHGTAELAIDRTSLAAAKRRTTPYGNPRGTTAGTWPTAMDKGFVGGTNDPTGLTHIGAREYDPSTARFLSTDPLMDPHDPQNLHAYNYAAGNPTTYSDPTGLKTDASEEQRYINAPKHCVGGNLLSASCAVIRNSSGKSRPLHTPPVKFDKPEGPSKGRCGLFGSLCPEGAAVPTTRSPAECMNWTSGSGWTSPASCTDAWAQYETDLEARSRYCGGRILTCSRINAPKIPSFPEPPGIPHRDDTLPPADPPPLGPAQALGYYSVGGDVCLFYCVGASVSGSGVQIEWGGFGTPGGGVTIMNSNVPVGDQSNITTGWCVEYFAGPCYTSGKTSDGRDWEAGGLSFGPEIGGQVGATQSQCIIGHGDCWIRLWF